MCGGPGSGSYTADTTTLNGETRKYWRLRYSNSWQGVTFVRAFALVPFIIPEDGDYDLSLVLFACNPNIRFRVSVGSEAKEYVGVSVGGNNRPATTDAMRVHLRKGLRVAKVHAYGGVIPESQVTDTQELSVLGLRVQAPEVA